MNLTAILADLKSERQRIETAITALEALDGTSPKPKGGTSFEFGANKPKGRHISPEGRARIAAAVRARWAKRKGQAVGIATPAKPKRRMSAAGRARIIAATKARWARFHAAKKAAKPAKKHRVMSAAAKKKISAAAKARWAKIRSAKK
jgi:hypothetical protein